jgi:hypothetical protein
LLHLFTLFTLLTLKSHAGVLFLFSML